MKVSALSERLCFFQEVGRNNVWRAGGNGPFVHYFKTFHIYFSSSMSLYFCQIIEGRMFLKSPASCAIVDWAPSVFSGAPEHWSC